MNHNILQNATKQHKMSYRWPSKSTKKYPDISNVPTNFNFEMYTGAGSVLTHVFASAPIWLTCDHLQVKLIKRFASWFLSM